MNHTTRFSPSPALLTAAREFAASHMPGTPAWAFFPRWYTNQPIFWLEATSGSTLMKVDLEAGTATFSSRLSHLPICGQTLPVPEHWLGL